MKITPLPTPARSSNRRRRSNRHCGHNRHWLAVLLTLIIAGIVGTANSVVRAEDTPSESSEEEDRIDLNEASAEQLTSLPGIGPSKAAAIVSHRERRPFRRIEDILRVRGIGRATFRALRDRITVSARDDRRRRRRPASD